MFSASKLGIVRLIHGISFVIPKIPNARVIHIFRPIFFHEVIKYLPSSF